MLIKTRQIHIAKSHRNFFFINKEFKEMPYHKYASSSYMMYEYGIPFYKYDYITCPVTIQYVVNFILTTRLKLI